MSLLLSILLTFSCCLEPPQSEVPENGTYIYEVAFAEWDGKTMSDEIGGCTGGPTIINFENQSIELC
jgi:hypothetical protein